MQDSWPSWARDGGSIAFSRALVSSPDERELWGLDTETWKADSLGEAQGDERSGIFSPDGDLMAYCTNDSGSYHLVVWDSLTSPT